MGRVTDFRREGAGQMTKVMKERLPSVARKSGGCEFVNLYVDPEDANRLFLLERWETRAKHEKYREWAMAQPGSSEAMSHLERDPSWMYLDDTGA
jgi:quinol monooxygenase YgiN